MEDGVETVEDGVETVGEGVRLLHPASSINTSSTTSVFRENLIRITRHLRMGNSLSNTEHGLTFYTAAVHSRYIGDSH